MGRFVMLLAATVVVACGSPGPFESEPLPLTLTVAGYVTIDSINPARGAVAVLDPDGQAIVVVSLDNGRYRASRRLEEGVDVCDGYVVFTEIVEERGRRRQERPIDSSSGSCMISTVDETLHHVDLDFPILLGR